jgi:hypothetical protein
MIVLRCSLLMTMAVQELFDGACMVMRDLMDMIAQRHMDHENDAAHPGTGKARKSRGKQDDSCWWRHPPNILAGAGAVKKMPGTPLILQNRNQFL